MKKYLKIVNNGLMHNEDLTLVGSSTKRGASDKIGQYGSGNKFALAYYLRNDILPIIYSGKRRIDIDCEIVLHRDSPIRVLTVDGQKTSITAGMGELDWKAWMALRETVSNAIDEGGFQMTTCFCDDENQLEYCDDKTTIYIPLSKEISDIVINWDHYFAFDRKHDYANEVGRIFFKNEPSPYNVYRKGIRCYDSDVKRLFDIDFNNIEINESRVTSSAYISNYFRKFMAKIDDEGIFIRVIKSVPIDFFCANIPNIGYAAFKNAVSEGIEFVPAFAKELIGSLFIGKSIVIPDEWYDDLKSRGIIVGKEELSKTGNFVFTRLDNMNIPKIKYYLKSVNCKLDVRSGKMLKGSPIEIHNGIAYVDEDNAKYNNDKETARDIVYHMGKVDLLDLFLD